VFHKNCCSLKMILCKRSSSSNVQYYSVLSKKSSSFSYLVYSLFYKRNGAGRFFLIEKLLLEFFFLHESLFYWWFIPLNFLDFFVPQEKLLYAFESIVPKDFKVAQNKLTMKKSLAWELIFRQSQYFTSDAVLVIRKALNLFVIKLQDRWVSLNKCVWQRSCQ
jgi:hypothetical protein